MGIFTHKRGMVGTAAAIGETTYAERKRGMDPLEAAAETFVGLGAPSRLGTVMLNAALSGAGVDERTPGYGAYLGSALMGYACRTAQGGAPRPESEVGALERVLLRREDGALDLDAIADSSVSLGRIADFAYALADDQARALAVSGVSEGAWRTFASTATYQLHANATRNGLKRRHLPPPGFTEVLLRLGYVLRFVDEVAGQEPYRKPR